MRFGLALLLCLLLLGSVLAKSDKDNEVNSESRTRRKDPCEDKHCGHGYECIVDENREANCICKRACDNSNPRHKVCSTKNVTFASECELNRQRCLCRNKEDGCMDRSYRRAHLHYYGVCKELPKCDEHEIEQFPVRMRDWLYLIMEELANRRSLHGEAMKMAREARKTSVKKWVLPIIWKYCDLDINHDSYVNSHELLPIAAPLISMEHCLPPFLENCDKNEDGNISLHEWGVCLGLKDNEISDDIVERCNKIRKNHKN